AYARIVSLEHLVDVPRPPGLRAREQGAVGRTLTCIPADACEARALPSVGGVARFEVVPAAEGQLRLEPIVSRDSDGTLWADELVVPVEPVGEVLVRRKEALTAVTEVSVEVGQTVELCVQVAAASGRVIDGEGVSASVELQPPEGRLTAVQASKGCHTFRGEGHGPAKLVFSVADQRRTVQVRVLSPDRVRTFVVTEVVQQGGAWRDVGPAPSPLLATRGSLSRTYRIDGVADDGLRLPLPPRCLTVDNGTVDSPGGWLAPDVFSLWLRLDAATLRWSSRCRAFAVPFEYAVRRSSGRRVIVRGRSTRRLPA
nr:hypothetical protein [Myxococcaceae bacterium]